MSLPFVSITSQQSANFNGDPQDLEGVCKDFTLQVTFDTEPSSGSVRLQGSLDGSHWVQLAGVTLGSGVQGSLVSASTHYARFVRAQIPSALSSPVSAYIAHGEVL